MSAVENMSSVDRAWLLMDRPSHPMMIVGLLVLDARIERAALRKLIERRFLAFSRFRSVPANGRIAAAWQESAQFDLDDHVLSCALPLPAGQQELQALVGELASTPFNPGRPPWMFHLVENFDGRSAVIVRIHHAYADGVALVQVLLSLADGERKGNHSNSSTVHSAAASRTDSSSGWLPDRVLEILQGGANLTGMAVHYTLHPRETSTLARQALGMAAELAHLGLLADDPATPLKRPMSGIRRAAWTDALPLQEVRTISHVLSCTVNDVLMSTLAGALGRYLESRGYPVPGVTIRAAVPVNLRGAGDPQPSMGNRFGLVFVDLPIGIRHPLMRLYAVRATIQNLKHSPQALITLGLLSLIGSLPATAAEPMIALFSSKASVVASNLPGPSRPLYLAGAAVSQLLFWVPQAGDIGIGVSMLSYDDRVQFGVIADRYLIPEPGDLVAEIGVEFERLVLLVLLGGAAVAPAPPVKRDRAAPSRRRTAPSHR
ncbi:MAG TPA: wax ester/triacylglycerol synthase family O-acyltransferase [Steroidobacteraceae bacterium]